ncbi:class I SAM-dependent methyltransferase [Aquipuribacter sp. MA13-6]|uniref:class I SAM-dependent methyltransferase n=1 Tax=unclassified Aquipuribacter TaxID=2635084 RepID=UPI003EEFD932
MPDRTRAARRPAGRITRGTTNPNRLRRFDGWFVRRHWPLLRTAPDPLVVDLGYGRAPVTVVELAARLRVVRPDVEVLGVEIDPERVAAAAPLTAPGLRFAHGGFDLAPLQGRRATMVRAFNVLRQYDEPEVAGVWQQLGGSLAPGGLLVDGTCDELGRLASWVVLDATGPRSLVLGWRLAGLQRPGLVAARLPKALIHRNVPGEPVHSFLTALDAAWDGAASLQSLGARQRLSAAAAGLLAEGWPVRRDPWHWRRGLLEVSWRAVAPAGR